jgi:hypothetical protein
MTSHFSESDDYMHPRDDPGRDIKQVREMLQGKGITRQFSDKEIDDAVEAARARIGGRRLSRCVVAAEDLARRDAENAP